MTISIIMVILAFKTNKAEAYHKKLIEKQILTDTRGDIIRFGFAPYQEQNFDLTEVKSLDDE